MDRTQPQRDSRDDRKEQTMASSTGFGRSARTSISKIVIAPPCDEAAHSLPSGENATEKLKSSASKTPFGTSGAASGTQL